MQLKKIAFIIFFLILGLGILSAQDEQPAVLMKQSHVQEIETYFFKPNETQDSLLITREEFNKEGRRTLIEIHEASRLKAHYHYFYLNDSIRTERKTYFGENLISVTKIESNKFGKEIGSRQFDPKGNPTGMISKTKYNTDQQVIETKTRIHGELRSHTKRKYYKNGAPKRVKNIKPKLLKGTMRFDEAGNRIVDPSAKDYLKKETFENYESSGKRMQRTEMKRKMALSTIGLNGRLDLKPNDVLVTETYFTIKGLIDYKWQYVNGKLVGQKKYKYLFSQ